MTHSAEPGVTPVAARAVTRLAARGVTLHRGSRRVVDDLTVEANAGEFIAVIGPNGAGKSSLLMLLAGLLDASSGDVALDDVPLEAILPARLALRRAYLPQNPRCDWPIPVERLVALGLTPRLPTLGDFSNEDRRRIDAAISSCDLVAQRMQAATTLSGGELARAMLARAMVSDPELLIVDEPLAGLDPRHAIDTARRLRALADDGRLVIAALHDLSLALRYATRLWAIRDGKLLADGEPRAVLDPGLVERLFDVRARLIDSERGVSLEFD